MSFLSNVMRAAINPATIAQLAMGPAGWASLAVRTIATAVGQEVLQALGEKLGLPQSVISLAQSGFAAATGSTGGPLTIKDAVSQLADQFSLSPMEQGQLGRTARDAFDSLLNSIVESKEFKAAKSGGKGQSIFETIAIALGQLADKKMNEMSALAKEIGALPKDAKQTHITELTGKMQAAGQEFGLISNAMTNVLKSIGEGVSTIARKG